MTHRAGVKHEEVADLTGDEFSGDLLRQGGCRHRTGGEGERIRIRVGEAASPRMAQLLLVQPGPGDVDLHRGAEGGKVHHLATPRCSRSRSAAVAGVNPVASIRDRSRVEWVGRGARFLSLPHSAAVVGVTVPSAPSRVKISLAMSNQVCVGPSLETL